MGVSNLPMLTKNGSRSVQFYGVTAVVGSFALCYTFQPAIAWLSSGILQVEPLISHTLPLAEFPAALEAFATGRTMKVHLRP